MSTTRTSVAAPLTDRGWAGEPQVAGSHPVWFGPAERPLFGWIHHPAGALARGGVLLCAPLAKEYQAAHYTLRMLAEQLADLGFVVLRFDYDGTGDSDGGPDDPDRVAAWRRSIQDAIALLRTTGITHLSLVGMRLGALLAANECAGADALVLWDPVVSGRSFLREQRAMAALTMTTPQPSDGSIESPWAMWSPEAVADVGAIALSPELALPADTLVLGRIENPLPDAFRRKLPAAHVEWDAVPRQPELMQYMTVPDDAVARVARWLDERAPHARTAITVPPPSVQGTVHDADGRRVTETPMRMGAAGLFGILSEGTEARGPIVVLVGGFLDHHVGPGRLWVSLARQWAAAGVRVLRIDFSGLGDSGVREGQRPQLPFAPQAVDDLLDVAAAASPGDPRDVILAGFCAGGYSVMEAAIMLAPRAVLVLNPAVFFDAPEAEEDGAVDETRRQAYQARPNWIKRLGRGPAIRAIRRHIPQWGYRLLDITGVVKSPTTGFELLVGQGVTTLVACGEADSEIYRTMAGRRIKALRKTGLFAFDVIDGLTHALLSQADREACTRMLTDYVMQARDSDGHAPVRGL